MIKTKFVKGIYESYYGNACAVTFPNAKRAFDLDSAEYIDISEVNPDKFLRKYNAATDSPASYKY